MDKTIDNTDKTPSEGPDRYYKCYKCVNPCIIAVNGLKRVILGDIVEGKYREWKVDLKTNTPSQACYGVSRGFVKPISNAELMGLMV